jgi:hypothetical protein
LRLKLRARPADAPRMIGVLALGFLQVLASSIANLLTVSFGVGEPACHCHNIVRGCTGLRSTRKSLACYARS